MSHIFASYAYGAGPRDGCWWDETCTVPTAPDLAENITADVAIVGGGYTGLAAALRLSSNGVKTVLLEAHALGWGASGRNGGFCCLGGGMVGDAALDARWGRQERLNFRQAEKSAVQNVEHLIASLGIEVDRHSDGETELAHRPKDMEKLRRKAGSVLENYGVQPQLIEPQDLAAHGMLAGPFYGALTVPLGFGLNPRKFLSGLVMAAKAEGALLFSNSAVSTVQKSKAGYRLTCPNGSVTAEKIIFATNGYSSESVPDWMAGRYMPGQSTVLVTRPLTGGELAAQGWTSHQMSYDTRRLLHYFRLMPDNRFLFGMRGGLFTGAKAETIARARIRQDFETMFPQWAHVESNHSWSGMVCLARNKMPFVGPISEDGGQWCAMCYHGNGVAMGSYAGKLVADSILDTGFAGVPKAMSIPLEKFPLRRGRRILMPPIYAALKLADTL